MHLTRRLPELPAGSALVPLSRSQRSLSHLPAAGGGATTNTPGTPSLTSLAERRCTVEVVTLTSGGTFGEPLCQGPSQQNPRLGQQVPAAGAKNLTALRRFPPLFRLFPGLLRRHRATQGWKRQALTMRPRKRVKYGSKRPRKAREINASEVRKWLPSRCQSQ